MILNRTYRLFSVTMALLLLLSSSGLTMDLHFCQGHLKRVNFIGKAKTCAEMALMVEHCSKKKAKSCHSKAKSCTGGESHDGCCDNKAVVLDLDIEKADFLDVNSSDLKENTAVVAIDKFILSNENQLKKVAFRHYKPPLPTTDIYILFESFLL